MFRKFYISNSLPKRYFPKIDVGYPWNSPAATQGNKVRDASALQKESKQPEYADQRDSKCHSMQTIVQSLEFTDKHKIEYQIVIGEKRLTGQFSTTDIWAST